jgi:hypothetical protein
MYISLKVLFGEASDAGLAWSCANGSLPDHIETLLVAIVMLWMNVM